MRRYVAACTLSGRGLLLVVAVSTAAITVEAMRIGRDKTGAETLSYVGMKQNRVLPILVNSISFYIPLPQRL